jgi:tetratricopeptide (TPR) repeat protein
MEHSMKLSIALSCSVALCLALAGPAAADFDAPKPKKVDCSKPANKNKPACKDKSNRASDDEIYNAAYWMAREGAYQKALEVLRQARNGDDPRILTATGFATRKLGDVDAALPYYLKALALNPGYVQAREYLGEAYLTKGNLAAAEGELSEIERRCGQTCTAYVHLAQHIDAFKTAGARPG